MLLPLWPVPKRAYAKRWYGLSWVAP